jgi:hypothetical protein
MSTTSAAVTTAQAPQVLAEPIGVCIEAVAAIEPTLDRTATGSSVMIHSPVPPVFRTSRTPAIA